MEKKKQPIGIFDSGIGGLNYADYLHRNLPNEDFIYIADQKNTPYGEKTNEEIQQIVTNVVNKLLEFDIKILIIACNTATVNSKHLCLDIPVIGATTPTINETIAKTKNKNVLVLATPITVSKHIYKVELEKHGIKTTELACPEFVHLVENGKMGTEESQRVVNESLHKYEDGGFDVIVSGCTHFAFLKREILDVFPKTSMVDGSNEVLSLLKEELAKKEYSSINAKGKLSLYTTGDKESFSRSVELLKINYDSIDKI